MTQDDAVGQKEYEGAAVTSSLRKESRDMRRAFPSLSFLSPSVVVRVADSAEQGGLTP